MRYVTKPEQSNRTNIGGLFACNGVLSSAESEDLVLHELGQTPRVLALPSQIK